MTIEVTTVTLQQWMTGWLIDWLGNLIFLPCDWSINDVVDLLLLVTHVYFLAGKYRRTNPARKRHGPRWIHFTGGVLRRHGGFGRGQSPEPALSQLIPHLFIITSYRFTVFLFNTWISPVLDKTIQFRPVALSSAYFFSFHPGAVL